MPAPPLPLPFLSSPLPLLLRLLPLFPSSVLLTRVLSVLLALPRCRECRTTVTHVAHNGRSGGFASVLSFVISSFTTRWIETQPQDKIWRLSWPLCSSPLLDASRQRAAPARPLRVIQRTPWCMRSLLRSSRAWRLCKPSLPAAHLSSGAARPERRASSQIIDAGGRAAGFLYILHRINRLRRHGTHAIRRKQITATFDTGDAVTCKRVCPG